MKLILDMELEPLKTGMSITQPGKEYYEQVLVRINNYPSAIVHTDTFYAKYPNEIYERLDAGKRVTVKAELILLEEEAED